jgi:OmpA-OmpF porin, OOP family
LGLVLALLLAAAPEANLSLLRPASGTDGLLGVEGARPPQSPDDPLELQLGFDAGYKPVRLGPAGRVDSRLGGWAQLAARLNEGLSIFAQLPVTLRQAGDVSALGIAQPSFGFTVGDIRVGARHGFLRGPLDLSAQLSLELATGAAGSLTDEPRIGVEALLSAARRSGAWELIGNALLDFRAPSEVGPVKLGTALGLRGGAAYWFSPRARAYGEIEARSSFRAFAQQSIPAEWRAGGTLCVTPVFAVDLAGGTRLDDGLGAPSLRGVVAVRYSPQLCSAGKEPQGPEPGLAELMARIAEEKAAREKAEKEARLPSLLADSELDAREAVLRAEALDLLDASEAAALAHASAFAEEDRRDSDGDGVPDRLDNCPQQKGPAANHGCPVSEKQIVALHDDRIEVLDKVYFAPGTTRIQPRSTRLLNQVANVLKNHPELLKLEVEGHTDDRGPAAMNTRLSLARARAVVQALMRRGVSPTRLVAKGAGPSRPVADNRTSQGRERNRRVEFRVVERKPTGLTTPVLQ